MSKWTTEGTGVMMAILCDGEHVGEYLAVERLNELEAEVERLRRELGIEDQLFGNYRDGMRAVYVKIYDELDTANRLLRELYVASRQVCEEAIDDYYRDTDPDAVLLRFDTALAAAEKHLNATPVEDSDE